MTIKHLFPSTRPSLDLNFAGIRRLDPRITFTRASTATYTDANGILQTAAAGEARFDHSDTGESLGLLIEEARTNLFLNSAALSTQSVTVTAGSHALSFYGTGTVALSGDATGTLVGTGDSDRVSLVVVAAAGTVTATVTGTVTNAQLEAGPFLTSYIPTAGSTATRAADLCTIEGAAFSSFFNFGDHTTFIQWRRPDNISRGWMYRYLNGDFQEQMQENNNVVSGTTWGYGGSNMQGGSSGNRKAAIAVTQGFSQLAYSGSLGTRTDRGSTSGVTDRMIIGHTDRTDSSSSINGHIARLTYYPVRLPDEQLQALTS